MRVVLFFYIYNRFLFFFLENRVGGCGGVIFVIWVLVGEVVVFVVGLGVLGCKFLFF